VTLDAPMVPGIFEIQQYARDQLIGVEQFAVNLTSPEASDIRPRTNDLGIDTPTSPIPGLPAGRHLWPWLIALAIGGLVFEWWWYHRRA
jgi:hypothetical protein